MASLSRWFPRVALGVGLLGMSLAAAPARSDAGADPDDRVKGMTVIAPGIVPGLMPGRIYLPTFRGNTRDKWRVYASLTEEKDGSRKVTLHLVVRGPARETLRSIDLEVDDDEKHLPLPSPGATVRQVSACRQVTEVEISGQDDLIRSLAEADSASVSYGGDPEERRYRLHDFELDELDRIVGLLDAETLPRPKETPVPRGDSDDLSQAGSGGVTNPVIVPESRVQPVYPEDGRRKRQEARVILQAIILKNGTVEKLQPLESTGDCSLEEAAIAAVRQWRYRPATMNGKPIDVYFTIVVDFAL